MLSAERLRAIPTDQLRMLNSLVVEEIKHRRHVESRATARTFRVGQKASFFSRKKGRDIFITITKINPTTVVGMEIGGNIQWTVQPTLLTPAL